MTEASGKSEINDGLRNDPLKVELTLLCLLQKESENDPKQNEKASRSSLSSPTIRLAEKLVMPLVKNALLADAPLASRGTRAAAADCVYRKICSVKRF